MLNNEEMKGRKLVELFEEGLLKVGDEIPYHNKGECEYVSTGDKNGYGDQRIFWPDIQLEWQVFGKDKYAGLEMITLISKNVLMPIFLRGAIGYIKGLSELDKIADSIFGRGEGSMFGRSINYSDIEKFLKIKYLNFDAYEGDRDPSTEFCKWPINIKEGKINGYTPGSFVEGKREIESTNYVKYFTIPVERIFNENAYMLFKDEPYFIASHMHKIGEEKTGKMYIEGLNGDPLCEGTTAIKEDIEYYSIMEGCKTNIGGINNILFDSRGRERDRRAGIRPIIYLRPDATMEMLGV